MSRIHPAVLSVDSCPFLHPPTGIGRYAQEVLDYLDRKHWSLRYHYGPAPTKKPLQMAEQSRFWRLPYVAHYYVYLAQHFEGNAHRQWDLYWEPNNVLAFPVRPKKLVVTHHDLSWFHHPEWHPGNVVDFFKKRITSTIDRADHIITVSNFVRNEMCDVFRLPQEQVSVIPNGVDVGRFYPRPAEEIAKVRVAQQLPERYILAVGSLEPRKNLELLLRAWAAMRDDSLGGVGLVLVGGQRLQNDAFDALLAEAKNVHRLGYVEDEDLPSLYAGADLLVYPSFHEGFGLPPLEALACGCPVAVAHCPGLEDLSLNQGVTWLNPYDHLALREVLREFLDAPQRISGETLEKVHGLTWAKSAQAHEDLFHRLLGRG